MPVLSSHYYVCLIKISYIQSTLIGHWWPIYFLGSIEDNALRWICCEYNLTSYLFSCQVPLQDNESDCGLFLLHYIQKFVEHAPKTMKPSDLDGNWEGLGVVSYEEFIRALYTLKKTLMGL